MSHGAKVNYFVIKGRFRELEIDITVKYSATLVAKYLIWKKYIYKEASL